jgi:hypothetical protein
VEIVVLAKNFNSSHFLFRKNPLKSVEVLSPEANLTSSHETKTTSFRRYAIAEADTPRDFLLKTGLKSDFGSVEPEQGVTKSNRAYAVSSDSGSMGPRQIVPFRGARAHARTHARAHASACVFLL